MKQPKTKKDLTIAKLQVALAMVLLTGVNSVDAMSAVNPLSSEDLAEWSYDPDCGKWQEDGLFAANLDNYKPSNCIRSLAIELAKEISK